MEAENSPSKIQGNLWKKNHSTTKPEICTLVANLPDHIHVFSKNTKNILQDSDDQLTLQHKTDFTEINSLTVDMTDSTASLQWIAFLQSPPLVLLVRLWDLLAALKSYKGPNWGSSSFLRDGTARVARGESTAQPTPVFPARPRLPGWWLARRVAGAGLALATLQRGQRLFFNSHFATTLLIMLGTPNWFHQTAQRVNWKQEKMLHTVRDFWYRNYSISQEKLLKEWRCFSAPGNRDIRKDAK